MTDEGDDVDAITNIKETIIPIFLFLREQLLGDKEPEEGAY